MSFVKIDNNNFEYVTVALRPEMNFISSSVDGGVTGSMFVSPFRSKTLKNMFPVVKDLNADGNISKAEDEAATLGSPKGFLDHIKQRNQSGNMTSGMLGAYLTIVNDAAEIQKNSKTIDMFRFDMPVNANLNRTIKNVVKKTLMPYHSHRYDHCNFTYSNYHTLNFLTTTTIPTGSALIYPNIESSTPGAGVYDLPSEFSVNFWINPRYSDLNYKTGTIFHLSSSIAISIVSGSSRDENNEPDKFKIMVQLSQSADKPPSTVNLSAPASAYPNDLIFTSSHFLKRNNWHNVTVQWSANTNNASGSIFVDDLETRYHIPSSTLGAASHLSPGGLLIGNYYDGSYTNLGQLLTTNSGSAAGFTGVTPASPGYATTIVENTFSHDLNAEVHEIRMFDKLFTNITGALKPISDLQKMRASGQSSFGNLKFYVPPFFFPTSSLRSVLTTPFEKITSSTDDPFNVAFSFGKNGKMINLENFTREFVVGQQPKLQGLVPETINTTVQNITADQFIYDSGSHKKRNFSILPNDNGLFQPNYYALSSHASSSNSPKFKTSVQDSFYDYSIISLEDMLPSSSLHPGLVQSQGKVFDEIVSASSQNPGVNKGAVLTIAQRTRDRSSDEIVIFDISNLYYGNRIHPGSFEMYDKDLTGSDGKIKVLLKDNGKGSLYRADALTKHATWNSVGNVLYDEGIGLVKTPHLFFFSKNETNISFKGEQNLHTMILNIPVYSDMFNSSSNPTYQKIKPSSNVNDEDLSTLYITTVNIHDNNFNIIMKANFSQPIFKTEEDEFVIRLKEDF